MPTLSILAILFACGRPLAANDNDKPIDKAEATPAVSSESSGRVAPPILALITDNRDGCAGNPTSAAANRFRLADALAAMHVQINPPPKPANWQPRRRPSPIFGVPGALTTALVAGAVGFCSANEEAAFFAALAQHVAKTARRKNRVANRLAVAFHRSDALVSQIERAHARAHGDAARQLRLALSLIEEQRDYQHPLVDDSVANDWTAARAAPFLEQEEKVIVISWRNEADRRVRLGTLTINRSNTATLHIERPDHRMSTKLESDWAEISTQSTLLWRRSERKTERIIENKHINVGRDESEYVFAVATALEDQYYLPELVGY